MEANLAAPPAVPVDLRQFDAMLATIRRAERDLATTSTYLAEARDALSAAPADPEAARRITMSVLRLRGDALALAQAFATLALPEA